jgi:hypothetical protein
MKNSFKSNKVRLGSLVTVGSLIGSFLIYKRYSFTNKTNDSINKTNNERKDKITNLLNHINTANIGQKSPPTLFNRQNLNIDEYLDCENVENSFFSLARYQAALMAINEANQLVFTNQKSVERVKDELACLSEYFGNEDSLTFELNRRVTKADYLRARRRNKSAYEDVINNKNQNDNDDDDLYQNSNHNDTKSSSTLKRNRKINPFLNNALADYISQQLNDDLMLSLATVDIDNRFMRMEPPTTNSTIHRIKRNNFKLLFLFEDEFLVNFANKNNFKMFNKSDLQRFVTKFKGI